MTGSHTYVDTTTQTFTHARRLASKVATDLKRMQRLCGVGLPTDEKIADFDKEATVLLSLDYLREVKYGFKRNGLWIEPTVRYTAQQLSKSTADDRPGGIDRYYDVRGASFYSFLYYKDAWYLLTEHQKAIIESRLPIKRSTGEDPGFNGIMVDDKSYSSGNLGLNRSMLRSF